MKRITEIDQPGVVVRACYQIGKRMFGAVPTPERVMAHRLPLMFGMGGLWGAIEWSSTIEKDLRALLQLYVATLYGSAY